MVILFLILGGTPALFAMALAPLYIPSKHFSFLLNILSSFRCWGFAIWSGIWPRLSGTHSLYLTANLCPTGLRLQALVRSVRVKDWGAKWLTSHLQASWCLRNLSPSAWGTFLRALPSQLHPGPELRPEEPWKEDIAFLCSQLTLRQAPATGPWETTQGRHVGEMTRIIRFTWCLLTGRWG